MPVICFVVQVPELSSQQIQEMARSAPDPSPLFGVGSGHETIAAAVWLAADRLHYEYSPKNKQVVNFMVSG